MKRITQRELRNQSAAILRAVESGEEFVITVDGRPAATLVPYRRRFVPAARVHTMLKTPTDPTVLENVRRHTDDHTADPWRVRRTSRGGGALSRHFGGASPIPANGEPKI